MTTVNEHAAKIAKPHTMYFIDHPTEVKKDGTPKRLRVPGVTTITGVMDKPALVRWANDLGLAGISTKEYVDELATIGTLTHYLIECHLKGEKEYLDDYTKNQIDMAQNGAIRYLDWQQQTGFEPITIDGDQKSVEMQLVSKVYRFGGTIDAYGKTRDGKHILCDIKTSKGVFGEHKTQVGGGYAILLEENGYHVDEVHIVRVGRTEDEGFDDITMSAQEVTNHKRRFFICRELYESNKLCNSFYRG